METLLSQLKIKADVVNIEDNGTMSTYYLSLHPGTKVSRIENCAIEIALGLKAYSKPIIRVIPQDGLVAVELLTNPLKMVKFFSLIDTFNTKNQNMPLPLILGKTHKGEDLITDLSIMPHLLIAGTTGSGKSVLLHSIINSLMMNRQKTKLVLIDPKKVELSYYENIKQLMYPVITEPHDALSVLSDLVEEMENRFRKMSRAGVNTISDFNKKKPGKAFPYIVAVIDEFSDFMYVSKKPFQQKLCMLAAKARACGIHLIIATQRPSVDVVTGLIKANFPSRISCRVSSLVDSRVVLNCSGAEKLLGKGDSLINSIGYDMVRFQGAFLEVDQIKSQCEKYKRGIIANIFNYIKGL